MAENEQTIEEWQAVLADFVAALRAKYGDNLDRVLLYGSRARGDYDVDSDVDLIVVLKHVDDRQALEKEILYLSDEVSFFSGRPILISPVVLQAGELETGSDPFRINVRREAIPV